MKLLFVMCQYLRLWQTAIAAEVALVLLLFKLCRLSRKCGRNPRLKIALGPPLALGCAGCMAAQYIASAIHWWEESPIGKGNRQNRLFRIHACIHIGRVDTLLAESDERKPYAVWRAYRLIGNLFIHSRKERFQTHAEALKAFLALTPVPKSRDYIDIDGCHNASFCEDYTGQLVTLSPVVLKDAHRWLANQLQIAKGGAGCKPNAWGEKVHCVSLRYGHKSTWDRQDILGIVNPKFLPRWAKKRIQTIKEKR